MTQRRRFLSALAGGAVALSRLAQGPAPAHRFAWFSSATAGGALPSLDALRKALSDPGYVEDAPALRLRADEVIG